MPSIRSTLPTTPFTRIVKREGVRMSKEGYAELKDIIKEKAADVAEQAARVSRHSGRSTVTKRDIEFVLAKERG